MDLDSFSQDVIRTIFFIAASVITIIGTYVLRNKVSICSEP